MATNKVISYLVNVTEYKTTTWGQRTWKKTKIMNLQEEQARRILTDSPTKLIYPLRWNHVNTSLGIVPNQTFNL